MPAIARMNAMLVATAEGFSAAFSKAGKDVKGFAGTVAEVAGGMAVYEIGKGLAETAYHNTVELVQHQLEAVDSTAKLSDTLGIATRELSRLQYAASYAGASNEDLSTGLAKMNKNLAEAAQNGTGAAADALAAMGLSAKELLNTPADERVGKIADALNAVASPAQRAAYGQDLFGKGAVKLMPLLAEGSEGLKRYGKEADQLGYSFDRVDAAQIEAANDAMQKVKNVVVGVATQLAIKLAPFIESVANKLSGLALVGDGMAATVTSGFEMVVKGVAGAADYLDLARSGFKFLQAGASLAIAGILNYIDMWGAGVVRVLNLLPGVEVEWTGTFKAMSAGLIDEAGKLAGEGKDAFNSFATGENSKAVGRFFDDVRRSSKDAAQATAEAKQKFGGWVDPEDAKAVGKVAEQLANLHKQVDQFDMSKAQKAGADVLAAGGSKEQAAEATRLQEQLDALEQQKKAHEDATAAAKKYYEETRTPAEKYAAEIERINELLMAGELDQETAQRAADKAGADLKKDRGGGDQGKAEGPKLLQAGSQEAAQFVAQIQRRQEGQDDQKQLVRLQQKGTGYLEQIARNTQAPATPIETVSIS